jgi:predicted NBD/HSP70 family sugar kinase
MLKKSTLDKSQPTTRDIREANRLLILHELLLHETSTRQELSQLTGLSTATVANLVTNLLEEGLIIEVGIAASQGGRPTSILSLNAAAGACVGVDVAETYILFDLYDLALKKTGEHKVELSSAKIEPQKIVQLIVSGLDTLLGQAGITIEKVVGIGISIPGPFEHSTGVSVFTPSWGWVNVPLKDMLEKEIKAPLYMDNPLKFNAIAEAWFGAGRDVKTMAAMVWGTGVGTGLVINGQLFHGASNTAGEWGHSIIVAGGRPCRCGSRGCVEAYIGATGILQTLAEIDPNSDLLFVDDQTRTIEALAAAARQNDPIALAVIHQTAFYMGAGFASLINIFNPELIIMDSWVADLLGPMILPEMLDMVKQQSLAQPFRAVRFALSDMTRNPVSLGAATLVLEEFLASTGRQPASVRS